MLDFAYLKQIDKYRKRYDAFPLPVIICDHAFVVYWSNRSAKQAVAALTAPEGLEEVVRASGADSIWEALESGASFPVRVPVPHGAHNAAFLPVQDEDGEVIGAVLLVVMEEDAAAQEPVSQMAHALSRRLREGVGGIFHTMDDMAVKADLLRSGWVHTGLNQIGIEGYRLLRVADNVSEYARFRGGAVSLVTHTMDLAEYLEEISETVIEIGRMAGIAVEFSLPGGVCPIHVERSSFELALFNLLHNSLYFTRPGNCVRVAAVREQGTVRLSVRDSGIGMADEHLRSAWQAYTAFPRDGAGIGLGLAVVRQVVDAHGAHAALQSSPGEGTLVTVHLPAATISQPLSLRQEAAHRRLDDRFSRLYIGLTDAVDSPYRSNE